MQHGYKLTAKSKKNYSLSKTFGTVHPIEFPAEYSVRSPFPVPDQNSEGLENGCTAYTVCGCAEDQDGIEYDDKKQYAAALVHAGLPDDSPMTINQAFDIPVKIGLWPKGKDEDPAKYMKAGYYFVDGSFDHFDSIRSALILNKDDKRAVGCGFTWYNEFERIGRDGILPDNPTQVSGGHSTIIDGWKMLGGQPYLSCESHQGTGYGDNGYCYLSRTLTNKLFSAYGAQAVTIKDAPEGSIMTIQLNWMQQIIEVLKQIIHSLMSKPMPNTVPEPTPVLPHVSRIKDWAKAIALQEQVRPELNNPCALKLTSLTASWGGQKGVGALDGGTLCYFPTLEMGYKAAENLLTLGAEDQLKAFHQARTLRQFTRVYANPPDDGYALRVAIDLKINADSDIKELL